MGDWAKPLIAMHCFDNLVQFISIHKFDTDTISLQWKSMMLNVMLSGVANLQHVNDNFLNEVKKHPQIVGKRGQGLELITKTKKY